MHEELLPLFPLQVVLFPRSALPLHIFEERYKLMINECLGGNSEFGIVLAREDGLSAVGCTAAVESVLHRYPDGRMDIVVRGRRRFALNHQETGSKGYAVGSITELPSVRETVDRKLERETLALYDQLARVAFRGESRVAERVGTELSFRLAEKAGMDLALRQRLLETPSENERLRLLHTHLVELLPRMEKKEEIERVIRSDGYL